jgi:hypothetical protein
MTNDEIHNIAGALRSRLQDHLLSLLYYPHPFGDDGFVAVFKDDQKGVVDLIAGAYSCVEPETNVYCLRHGELFELSLPVYSWLNIVNRHTLMVYWLKHKGEVLFGRDIRDELILPRDPRLLLDNHLAVCKHFLRSGVILDRLQRRRYRELMGKLGRQVRILMATALLLRGEWETTEETVAARFEQLFPDPLLGQVWGDYELLMREASAAGEGASRDSALEAVWLFEGFVRRLGAYAL